MTTRLSLLTVALVLWSSYVAHGQSTYRTLLPLNYAAEDAPKINGTMVSRTTSTFEECIGDTTYHMFDVTTVGFIDGNIYVCDSMTLNANGEPLQLDSNTVINDNISSSLSNPNFALSQILPSIVGGREGLDQAFSFDGVRQYLNLGNLRSTCMGNPEICTDGVTYSVWMKLTNEQNRASSAFGIYISGGGSGLVSYGIVCYSRHGHVKWMMRAFGKVWIIPDQINVNYGIWQHMIATWHKDTGLAVYLNGVHKKKTGVNWRYTPDVRYDDFVLGRSNDFPWTTGLYGEFTLQDFKVYYRSFFVQTAAKNLYESSFSCDPDFDLANPSNFLPQPTVGFTASQALTFDGLTTSLSLGNYRRYCLGNLDKCPNGVTFSLWLKLTNELGKDKADESFVLSGGGQETRSHGVALYTKFNRLFWWFHLPDGRLWSNWYEDNGVSLPITMNRWTHLIATWKADQGLFLYDNGALVTSVIESTNAAPGSEFNDFIIGQTNDNEDYGVDTHGEFSLEDLRVFYRFLSESEAQQLFLLGISQPYVVPAGRK